MSGRYSEDDKAAALATLDANDGDTHATSRATGISRRTLQRWQNERAAENAPDDGDHLATQAQALQASLLGTSAALVGAIRLQIDGAPLNQLSAALGVVVDRFLKLDEYIQQKTLMQGEQVIRVEYLYPDGTVHDAPPWAEDDFEYTGAVPGGGLRAALRQDGNGQDRGERGGAGRGDVLVARPDLHDGDAGMAGLESPFTPPHRGADD